MTASDTAAQPLTGLRVLDLSRVLAGPWATQILGDLGAEVTKVEKPGTGDDTRNWGPPWQTGADGAAASGYYLACNRNKKSIAIDIADPKGAAIIRRMAETADVVVENFKVGGLTQYGLDDDSLRAINPRLIYCSITGFGQDGPYAARGGYDFLIQGMGGLMSVTGPETGEPTKVGVPVVDLFTGLYAVIAIQAALRHRDATGQGQHIDCSLLDSAVAILANQSMNWLVGGTDPRPMGNSHPNVVPYRTFKAADGHIIVAIGNDTQFRNFCGVLNRPDLRDSDDYRTNSDRLANRAVLERALAQEIEKHQSSVLLTDMAEAGVPGGPINSISQVFGDPHVQARGILETVTQPDGTPLALTRFPAKLSGSPAKIQKTPPTLGADSIAVLTEMGYSEAEIETLIASGIVDCRPRGH